MDNWIFLALSLILSIPVGIFVNIVTPLVKSNLKNHSLSAKERQINILIAHYKEMKKLRERPSIVDVRFAKWCLLFVVSAYPLLYYDDMIHEFLDTNFGYFYGFILSMAYYIFLLFLEVQMVKSIIQLMNVLSFTQYKRKTVLKLVKLGGRAQDLDKEEN